MSSIETQAKRFSIENTEYIPKEEMLDISKIKKKLVIGLPKESSIDESRIALTPQAVELLVNNGHQVIIESGAGVRANYEDKNYIEAGGVVVHDNETVFKSDIILKIAPLNINEISMLKDKQTIFSALHITSQTPEKIKLLQKKRVKAIAYEFLNGDGGINPVQRSMNEIAGILSISVASEYLSNTHMGKGVLLGGVTGISPTEVVIFGAGTASEYAARAAFGLGANIKIFDNSLHYLRKLQYSLNNRIFTSVFQAQVIKKALISADVIIGAMDITRPKDRYLISEELVQLMKTGAVIIDLNIDNGSCFETSKTTNHSNPTFTKHGVVHYCVPNIASRASRTASIALSNVLTPILINIGENGGIANYSRYNSGMREGIYIYNGILTNIILGRKFKIDCKDIDLLMAAF